MNHEVLDAEIETLRSLGIAFKTGKTLGKDFTTESLRSQGYSAVFIGIGAQEGRKMNIPGEDIKGVISGLTFLKNVYDKKQYNIGHRAVIVGGGNTAIDAARTARRLGAEEVYIAYRRTKDEMPATTEEIAEAEAEGIKVMYLVAPKAVESSNGRVTGIRMVNHVLGEKDQSDRRRPEAVPDAEFLLPCDIIITALGQKPASEAVQGLTTDKQGMVINIHSTAATNVKNVYAGGDVVHVDSVISAIAAGKTAACSIDKSVAGENAILEYEPEYPVVSKEAVLRRVGYFKDEGRTDLYTADGTARLGNFSTYMRTLTEEEAVAEAQRCLNCGCGEGCGICATICSDFAIHLKSPDVWEVNREECVACGMCYNMCPNKNIEMVDTHVLVK
jgi:NADPH-dependent glutamate synthase beta subunit-like oxidoreductase